MKDFGSKKHLTFGNRKFIERELKQKSTIREIAFAIGFTERTIYRELQKGGGRKYYCAETAQKITEFTRKSINQSRAKLRHPKIVKEVLKGFASNYSPKKIARTIKNNQKFSFSISHETIYEKVKEWKEKGIEIYKFLPSKNKKRDLLRGWQESRGYLNGKKSIRERPSRAKRKRRLRDFEMDIMEGIKQDGYCVVVVRDRLSSFLMGKIIPDKKAETWQKAVIEMLEEFYPYSITLDNGSETTNWKELEKELNTDVYFCTPGKPWQKGGVENGIKQLRRFFPKKRSVKGKESLLRKVIGMLNYTPMTKLNDNTPATVFLGKPKIIWVPLEFRNPLNIAIPPLSVLVSV